MFHKSNSTGGESSTSNSSSSNQLPPVEIKPILKWEAYKKVR